MTKSNIFVALFIAVLVSIAVIGFSKVDQANSQLTKGSDNYTIVETWELPMELNEISGMVWLDHHILACIQDENGIVFIYDLDEKAISEEIPFAGNGDYEGIAHHDNILYVIQSDGLLYEINPWNTPERSIKSHQTRFTSLNNLESLTYSVPEKSLLTAPKDKDKDLAYKGIYKVGMSSSGNLDQDSALYKIDLHSEMFDEYRGEKIHKTFSPSEIAVHPLTNEIYVLEGKVPKLLILDEKGILKRVYKLDEIHFPQPEGMTFSAQGDLHISNEAVNNSATILLVELKDPQKDL